LILLRPALGTAATSGRQRLLLLIGYAVLVGARIPSVWPHGRLWAEEGWTYLSSAWSAPWYVGLTTIHTGYMNLPASGATTLAVHRVPLEYAPLVTMAVALLIQVTPAILLAVSGIEWLRDWRSLALALLIVALPPFAEEVWLNTITSQFHIQLAVAIILAAPPGRGAARWFQAAVLLLAPLSGPGGAMLLPLFMLRAWLDRSPPRLVQALLLLPGALVQLALVVTHPEPARGIGLNLPVVLAAIAGKHLLLPLLGPRTAMWLTRDLPAAFAAGHGAVLLEIAPVAAFGALGAVVWQRGNNAETRWLFGAAMVIMTVSYLAALTPRGPFELLIVGFGARYYVAPTVLIGLSVLGVALTGPGTARICAGAVVAWLLVVGLANYPHVDRAMARGPQWRDEVAAWRADPAHPIALWPTGWTMQLTPQPP
jgi:hypothetical protein